MTTITTYTTYADIRAALGVSDEDLEDETLALSLYADSLTQDLEDIALTLPDTIATTKANVTPTDNEVRFLTAARLFATYAVAKQLTAALPLFAAQQVSDSKATVQRFDNPYRDTIKQVVDQYERTRNRLMASLTLIGTVTADATPRVYMGVSSPSSDPVTGT